MLVDSVNGIEGFLERLTSQCVSSKLLGSTKLLPSCNSLPGTGIGTRMAFAIQQIAPDRILTILKLLFYWRL